MPINGPRWSLWSISSIPSIWSIWSISSISSISLIWSISWISLISSISLVSLIWFIWFVWLVPLNAHPAHFFLGDFRMPQQTLGLHCTNHALRLDQSGPNQHNRLSAGCQRTCHTIVLISCRSDRISQSFDGKETERRCVWSTKVPLIAKERIQHKNKRNKDD